MVGRVVKKECFISDHNFPRLIYQIYFTSFNSLFFLHCEFVELPYHVFILTRQNAISNRTVDFQAFYRISGTVNVFCRVLGLNQKGLFITCRCNVRVYSGKKAYNERMGERE